jgi:hypothetical protein
MDKALFFSICDIKLIASTQKTHVEYRSGIYLLLYPSYTISEQKEKRENNDFPMYRTQTSTINPADHGITVAGEVHIPVMPYHYARKSCRDGNN